MFCALVQRRINNVSHQPECLTLIVVGGKVMEYSGLRLSLYAEPAIEGAIDSWRIAFSVYRCVHFDRVVRYAVVELLRNPMRPLGV